MNDLSELERLKNENKNLRQQLKNRCEFQDSLHFSWAGNLGEWKFNVKTNQVIPNPLKVEALGYSMDEFEPVYQFFTDMIHPDDYEHTMEAMLRHLRGEAPVYEVEYRIQTKDGTWKWFYDRGTITEYGKDGKPEWIVGIVFDITEQKESEQELKRLLAEKDKFFSILAHDLKNPFSAFLGFTEILANDLDSLSIKDIKEYSRDLYNSANQLYKLLQNLLEWARLQRGRVECKPTRFAVKPLVQEVVDLIDLAARNKNITIASDVPPELECYADINMVRTILRNLLNNAVKFTRKNGRIEIAASEHQGHERKEVFFSVKDNGIGMDKKTAESVFSLLEQNSVTKRGTADEQGTGLGLILCRDLVKLNQGRISVSSEPEKGSTFTVSLPADDG